MNFTGSYTEDEPIYRTFKMFVPASNSDRFIDHSYENEVPSDQGKQLSLLGPGANYKPMPGYEACAKAQKRLLR